MKIISKQLGNKDMIRGGPETKRSKFQNITKIAKTASITNLRVYLRKLDDEMQMIEERVLNC